jgi:hypothetical protein
LKSRIKGLCKILKVMRRKWQNTKINLQIIRVSRRRSKNKVRGN